MTILVASLTSAGNDKFSSTPYQCGTILILSLTSAGNNYDKFSNIPYQCCNMTILVSPLTVSNDNFNIAPYNAGQIWYHPLPVLVL